MPSFIGSSANETITPTFVSSTVSKSGGSAPSAAEDTISAGGGDDIVEGGGGNDTVDLGDGNDRFTHRYLDGSDVVSGGTGFDIFAWIGSSIDVEPVGVFMSGSQLKVDGSAIDSFERIEIDAKDEYNVIFLEDLTLSSLQEVVVEVGTGQNDVDVTGTGAADVYNVSVSNGNIRVAVTDYAITLRNALTGSVDLSFRTGAGADLVDGRALVEGAPAITVFAGEDSDEVYGGPGADWLYGEGGDDVLIGGAGADRLDGGAWRDVADYSSSDAAITIILGEGTEAGRGYGGTAAGDSLFGIEAIIGTGFADSIIGNSTPNNLNGGAGSDQLYGNDGFDTLDGGSGADFMDGGSGADIYYVDNAGDRVIERAGEGILDFVLTTVDYVLEAGSDVETIKALSTSSTTSIDLTGNEIANDLIGNYGANRLDGGGGVDDMVGDDGNDTYIVDVSGDKVFELSGEGTDTVRSSATFVLPANVEKLVLTGTAPISGTGNSSANIMAGNAGANDLRGEAGADTLNGGGGNDRLFGGTGNDTLKGDAGADRFYFNTALNAATNKDKITDFNPADDSIHLAASIFSGIAGTGTLAASAFRNGKAAADSSDRIIYDKAAGNIWYDSDGTGSAAKILFATVAPGVSLTNADFIVF
ncbi:MAG: hypothetical protein M3177_00955 [Pseudomonadota bacterium]|nr:hypothetical protein [Pseudomonadota bacterium]